ncbi:MAG TPA: response regulator [Polyangiaceae bacterium]
MRRRILLVDDNAALAAAFARGLRSEYDVLVCTDGLAALERVFTDGPFDALVVDIRMPGLDGLRLQSALVETSPEHVNRIIFVTGGDIDPEASVALQDRIVLHKPFGPSELRLAIQRVIGSTGTTQREMAAVRPAAEALAVRSAATTLPAPPRETPSGGRIRTIAPVEEVNTSTGSRRDSRRD